MSESREAIQQVIRRKADGHFTTIANEALRDPRLSYRAKGILASCLTHSHEFWLSRQWIDSHGSEGRDAITTAINELRTYGYVHDEYVQEGSMPRRRMVWTDHPSIPENPHCPGVATAPEPASTLVTTENPLERISSCNWKPVATENPLQLKTRRAIRRTTSSRRSIKKEIPPICPPTTAETGKPAAGAASIDRGKSVKVFRPSPEDIPAELLPMQAELLAFWQEKAGSRSQGAWRMLLTELGKIQQAVGGGTAVCREQLQQATQCGWRSVTHRNWLAYGQQRQRQAPARLSRSEEAAENVIAFFKNHNTQETNPWPSTTTISSEPFWDCSSSADLPSHLARLA